MAGNQNQENSSGSTTLKAVAHAHFKGVKDLLLRHCHGHEAVMDALEGLESTYRATAYALDNHLIQLPPEDHPTN